MSEDKTKLSFFKTIKNSILNTEDKNNNILESNLGVMSTKSVTPKEVDPSIEKFSGISNSKELDIQFAENFIHSGGKFIYCESTQEMFSFLSSLRKENDWNHIYSWNQEILDLIEKNDFQENFGEFLMEDSDVAISMCYNLSSKEGVIVLSPEQATNRRLATFPETHIIIATKNQLKSDIDTAIQGFENKFGDRLPSILELYEDKPVSKSNHSKLLSAEGTKNVLLLYIDSEIE